MYSDLSRPPLAGPRGGALRIGGGWRAVVVPETVSTNADVVSAARAGEAPGYVLVAEHQTGGRGRQDRVWTSPPRAGLTFSALLTAEPSPWVPLLAGVAVQRALAAVCGLDAELKWPNDVLLPGGKVCGVLAEAVATPDGPRVVLGVGLNVTTTPEELPADRPATSLALAGASMSDRVTILRAILRELAAPLTPVDYRGACATIGRRVEVHLPGDRVVSGTAEGVDDDGRLVVDDVPYAAGDVVHLR